MIRVTRLTDVVPGLASGLLLGAGLLAGMLFELPRPTPLSQLVALSQPKHLTMTVRNLDRTVEWYQDKLGFARLDLPSQDGKTARVLLVGSRNLIELRRGSDSDGLLRTARANGPEIALQLDDVDAATAELKQRGVEIVAEPRHAKGRNLRVSIIRDLNGRIVELQQPL